MMGLVLVFVDFFFESIEIELVFDEIFINFTEEDMILKATEPLNPSNIDVFTELRFLAHFKLLII